MSCNVMQCHAMSCNVMQCHAMSCNCVTGMYWPHEREELQNHLNSASIAISHKPYVQKVYKHCKSCNGSVLLRHWTLLERRLETSLGQLLEVSDVPVPWTSLNCLNCPVFETKSFLSFLSYSCLLYSSILSYPSAQWQSGQEDSYGEREREREREGGWVERVLHYSKRSKRKIPHEAKQFKHVRPNPDVRPYPNNTPRQYLSPEDERKQNTCMTLAMLCAAILTLGFRIWGFGVLEFLGLEF